MRKRKKCSAPAAATTVIINSRPALHGLRESIIGGLSSAQLSAYQTLITGGGPGAAALAAGVHRATLYDWLRQDQPLALAVRQWKLDTIAAQRARSLNLAADANDAVAAAIQKGDARVALRLLERLGVITGSGPGETLEEAAARRAAARATIEEINRDRRRAAPDPTGGVGPSPGPDGAEPNRPHPIQPGQNAMDTNKPRKVSKKV